MFFLRILEEKKITPWAKQDLASYIKVIKMARYTLIIHIAST